MKIKIITACFLAAILASTVVAQDKAPRRAPPEPGELATKIMADFDADGSSTLNEVELARALESMRNNRPRPPRAEGTDRPSAPPPDRKRPDPAQIAQRMLENHDANTDGFLSHEELVEAVANMPLPGRGKPGPRKDRG